MHSSSRHQREVVYVEDWAWPGPEVTVSCLKKWLKYTQSSLLPHFVFSLILRLGPHGKLPTII